MPSVTTYYSAGVSVYPDTGTLHVSETEQERLSPVNMKVLMVLLEAPQQVVSRNTLFEKVWPNQTISDDALTRCISDLRATLGKLLPDVNCVDTVPKRGYRWVHPVEHLYNRIENNKKPKLAYKQTGITRGLKHNVLVIALTGLFVVLSMTGLFWWIFPKPVNTNSIAVIPFSASDTQFAATAVELREVLIEALVQNGNHSVLAKFALQQSNTDLRALHVNYGVRKIVEGHIFTKNNAAILSLTIVDAQTALVEEVRLIDVNEAEQQIKALIEEAYFDQIY